MADYRRLTIGESPTLTLISNDCIDHTNISLHGVINRLLHN